VSIPIGWHERAGCLSAEFFKGAIAHLQFTQNVVDVIVYCFWAIVLDGGNFPIGQTFCNTTQDFWFAIGY
jgi:hypothetical protein